ncbi:type VI secretion system accessory protein TagJ, partial [Ameyamaea chiangmaiensis]
DAETLRPRVAGTFTSADGRAATVDDLRDVDDVLCGSLEVLTTTGKCYWLPMESLVEVVFHAPRRPRDLYWRRATVVVRNGPEGDVYLPTLYDPPGDSDALRLGRATAWSDDAGPVRGQGQKTFLIGDDAREIMTLGTLTFAPSGA